MRVLKKYRPRLYDSAVVEFNSSVFWVITLRELVSDRRFGTTYCPMFKGLDA